MTGVHHQPWGGRSIFLRVGSSALSARRSSWRPVGLVLVCVVVAAAAAAAAAAAVVVAAAAVAAAVVVSVVLVLVVVVVVVAAAAAAAAVVVVVDTQSPKTRPRGRACVFHSEFLYTGVYSVVKTMHSVYSVILKK